MPARQPKQTARKTAKETATSRNPKGATVKRPNAAAAASVVSQRRGGARRRPHKARASWKPVRQTTKSYVLHTFDAAINLLTHKVPDDHYTEVHDALMSARNQVAACFETAQVPPSKHDYKSLSATLVSLKEVKEQLEQRQTSLSTTLHTQKRELQKLQEEKEHLQTFGQLPEKHHPLLSEPMEKELHLNFDIVK